MNISDPKEYTNQLLINNFPHLATDEQNLFLKQLSSFLISKKDKCCFILKGYAGTGKTTLVKTIVNTCPQIKLNTVLLAPTGRAAKVLSSYSNKQACTIHRKIYFFFTDNSGKGIFMKQKNKHKNTVFIIDEASMISGKENLPNGIFDQKEILNDLLDYVYSGENCKIILIGDTAQLPPVGSNLSPALNYEYIKDYYYLNVAQFELTDVIRQEKDSGILFNATQIRQQIRNKNCNPKFVIDGFNDTFKITGIELQDALYSAYSNYGTQECIMITRSNKRANLFNQQIRNRILYYEEELSSGDLMMIVKNNYFWLTADSEAGFIANGDIIEILKVIRIEEIYGYRFADVIIRLIDYPNEPDFEVKLVLDAINSDGPALSHQDNMNLLNNIIDDYIDIKNKSKKYKLARETKYFNALQVKFAYSVTCHKSQGGQWDAVFLDQGYITTEMIDNEYLRWLYTAITRAKKEIYFINFNKSFFEEDE